MLEKKLFKQITVKINGVRFAIRKLSPSLFLDKDYLFPMTSVSEKAEAHKRTVTDQEMLAATDTFKDKMKDTIEKSVVYVKKGLFSKKLPITMILEALMDNPEMYAYLFQCIVEHSLDLKKKSYLRY